MGLRAAIQKVTGAAVDAIKKGSDVTIYGPGGMRRSTRTQRGRLAGSHFDYATEAGALYDNGIVLPAINWKANAVSECELIVQKFDAAKNKWERAIEQGAIKDALQVLDLPNDYYDGTTMFHGVQLSWDCRGNSYLLKRRDRFDRLIGFYWCPHFQIRPLADRDNPDGTKLLTYYEYIPFNGAIQYINPADVVHLRYGIDPRDPASGLSPLYAELRDVCADNEISNWLASILRQGGTPGAILSPKVAVGAPTDAQKKQLRELWSSFVGDKRGEAFMSPVPIDVVTPTWSPSDLSLDKIQNIPTPRICAALGFDPMVIGLPSSTKTYSNYEQAADAAGKLTILPAIRKWTQQMTRQILPEFGIDPNVFRFEWDISAVSWLQDDTDDLHKRVRDDFKAGLIDRFQAKEWLGLQPDPTDKDVYAATTMGLPVDAEEDDDEKTPPPTSDPDKDDPAPKKKKKQMREIAERSKLRRREYEKSLV